MYCFLDSTNLGLSLRFLSPWRFSLYQLYFHELNGKQDVLKQPETNTELLHFSGHSCDKSSLETNSLSLSLPRIRIIVLTCAEDLYCLKAVDSNFVRNGGNKEHWAKKIWQESRVMQDMVPLKGENISSHAHKAWTWCLLLGVLFKMTDEQPLLFFWRNSPPPDKVGKQGREICVTKQSEFGWEVVEGLQKEWEPAWKVMFYEWSALAYVRPQHSDWWQILLIESLRNHDYNGNDCFWTKN